MNPNLDNFREFVRATTSELELVILRHDAKRLNDQAVLNIIDEELKRRALIDKENKK